MKVAFVTPEYYPKHSGGAGISSKLIVEALRRHGASVDVFALTGDERTCRTITDNHYELPAGSRYSTPGIPEVVGKNAGIWMHMPDLAQYDVLHNYIPSHAPATILKFDIPTVTTVNSYPWVCLHPQSFLEDGCPPITFLNSIKYADRSGYGQVEKLVATAAYYAGRHLLKRSDVITVQTEGMAEILEQCSFEPDTLAHVPNIADPRFSSNHESNDDDQPENTVLFVGRLADHKGPMDVVDAFSNIEPQLPESWRLELYGDGPLAPRIRRAINRRDTSNISLHWAPYHELPEVYRRASVVVHASKYPEPFSRTWLEAMATDTAIVCSAHPSSRSALADTAEFFQPFDDGSLAESLLAVLEDEGYRRRLATRNGERLEASRPENIAARYLDVYDRAMT